MSYNYWTTGTHSKFGLLIMVNSRKELSESLSLCISYSHSPNVITYDVIKNNTCNHCKKSTTWRWRWAHLQICGDMRASVTAPLRENHQDGLLYLRSYELLSSLNFSLVMPDRKWCIATHHVICIGGLKTIVIVRMSDLQAKLFVTHDLGIAQFIKYYTSRSCDLVPGITQ